MQTKRDKRQKKRRGVVIKAKKSVIIKKPRPETSPTNIFWPDRVDHVRAIAARGLTDDEMAVMMGVSDGLLDSWKKFYPDFAKAIEEGRSLPDQQVIAALHKNAIGYEREVDVVVRGRRGAEVVTAKMYYPGETAAQRYWLNNRQPKNWKERQSHDVKTPRGETIHHTVETKQQVIDSIINLIPPRPDSG